jgi:hypothetical protein
MSADANIKTITEIYEAHCAQDGVARLPLAV